MFITTRMSCSIIRTVSPRSARNSSTKLVKSAVAQQLTRLVVRLRLLAPDARRAEDRPEDPALQPRVHPDENVLERRHVLEQPDVLERAADPALRNRVRGLAGHVLPVEHDPPGCRPVDA